MRIIFNRLIIIPLVITTLFCCSEKEISCTLRGNIHNRDSDTLILVNALNINENHTYIPIIDSAFEYTLTVPYGEVYELMFKEEFERMAIRQIYFVAEDDILNFELYNDEDHDLNRIEGGFSTEELNNYYKSYQEKFSKKYKIVSDSIAELYKMNIYYSKSTQNQLYNFQTEKKEEELKKLNRKLCEINYSQDYEDYLTPEAIILRKKLDSLDRVVSKWEFSYIKSKFTIGSYYLLLQLFSSETDLSYLEDPETTFELYDNEFPNHPYSIKAEEIKKRIQKANSNK